LCRGGRGVDGPDAGSVVGAAGCEVPDVGREEDSSDVSAVSCEAAHRNQRGEVSILDHTPNEDTSSIVAGTQHGPIRSNSDAGNRDVVLRNQLMTAFVLAQIPDSYCARAIATNEFSLVWVDDHVVDWTAVVVIPLHAASSSIPNLDSTIFRGRHHPFSLAVKGDACDIVCVSFECEDGARVGGLDIVELDGVVASGGEIAFIWRDA
jgi:hypothetical protein